jgi:NDP-sugar pyrophosphorylase family protein
MQIVIPMSGFGERFRRAGYGVPKPLIEIDGKPIIAHVIDMFEGEADFLFICNQEHLDNRRYNMEDILRKHCPTGKVLGISSHKLGPIYAVRQALDWLDMEKPVIVNYCDFTCYWDYSNFKEFVLTTRCDGAIPAYKGFHPHTLGSTNYAYMQEADGWVLDIQEKKPYTDNRMEEYASSGTYYFATGSLMEEAFRKTMEQELSIGGEYYVSLAYKSILKANGRVAVYPLQHFMQWGTPEDVAEYLGWSEAFRGLAKPLDRPVKKQGSIVIPMAGMGQRFADEGYALTKPLIPVSGKPMVLQATTDLPESNCQVFVFRTDMPGYDDVAGQLRDAYPNVVVEAIPGVTEGQACTALLGIEALVAATEYPFIEPFTFGACDNGVLYDAKALQHLVDDPSIDIIVWGVRGHPNAFRHPQMYGWISEENGRINHVSVKKPLETPATDPIVVGTFTFRSVDNFRRVVQHLIAREGRVNGEFYLDSCINDAIELGLHCHLFEVNSYLSWGTPNDLRTFEYWQSCFHKWKSHPYRLELDSRLAREQLECLEEKYQQFIPTIPT